MKEQIDMIPVNDAFLSGDECPFCYLERKAEENALRCTAGPSASYMEPDVRAVTDKKGFCRVHMKKLYDYGNALGAALILQTYMAGLLKEFDYELEDFRIPEKKPLLGKRKSTGEEPYWQRLGKRVDSCYICDKIQYNMARYYHTFFVMLKDPEFRSRVENCKGFCLEHFAKLLELAEEDLPNGQRDWFYATVLPLMREQMIRVKKDLDWLVAKYDYRNAGADWKNSQDALQRSMQKLQGSYPADPPYKNK